MSFLEKLKKNMGNPVEELQNESGSIIEDGNNPDNAAVFAATKNRARNRARNSENESGSGGENENEEIPAKNTAKKSMPKKNTAPDENEEWLETEGQLAVNVFQTENDLIIQTAIAGIKTEDLDIQIEEDVINLKGTRQNPLEETGDYFIEECYWGPFSRKIILPVEVDSSNADAAMKDGILTIRLPKIIREKKKRLTIKN